MKDVATEQYWGVDEHGLDYFPDEMQSKITTEGLESEVLRKIKEKASPFTAGMNPTVLIRLVC
jgi:hypothetical protein